MPLGGSGPGLGAILAGAVGAPASAGGFFQTVGSVIAAWSLESVRVMPGAMAASGGAVSGLGSFQVEGSAQDLGTRIADALAIPATAASAREKWIVVAQALVEHFGTYGQANGTGLTSGTPCGGAGTLQWTSPTFAPPLAARMTVDDPVAGLLLEAFAVQLLAHISSNATIVSLSLSGPPMSAPENGPVTGTGTLA